jgi:murein DD-endopeptidase MepM/ murein hydrolase activator NlpD
MRSWLLIAALLLLGRPSAQAQDGDSPPVGGAGIVIHVVQRDETLFQIAQQYGTTIDTIATLNNLADPGSLQIGQRLSIPGSTTQLTGVMTTHIVEPGETLFTIAERYNSTPQSLSQVNNVLNADALYIGQSILVTQGANGEQPLEVVSTHRVQPGDYLLKVALHYGIPLLELADANHLPYNAPLQVGHMLIVPGSESGGRFISLPAPLLDFQLIPLPAEQGRSLSLLIATDEGATLSGTVMGETINYAQDGTHFFAMIGIHSFTEPGIYPMSISATDASGQTTTYEARIRIVDGSYGQESIDIPPERQDLLDPVIVQAELERVEAVMSGFTPIRYFGGLMGLPSTGPVTSQYGTRRSYNGSPFDTFHGGADFGGAPGSLILAPAAGIVALAEPLQVRGNTVIIDHGWGVYTGYWHQTEYFVEAGQFVDRGEPIGTIGATGLITGPHLHWEMWVGGVQVDPLQWLSFPFGEFNQPVVTTSLTPTPAP